MKVGLIKNKVKKVEGFDVQILDEEIQRPYRSDKLLDFNFDYKRAASAKLTVSQWSRQRMPESTDILVLDGEGEPVHGRTTLNSVRQTYL